MLELILAILAFGFLSLALMPFMPLFAVGYTLYRSGQPAPDELY